MSTQLIRGTGNIYDAEGKQVIEIVNYQVWEKPQTEYTLGEWWGSFIPETEHRFVQGEYILELQDKRKGKIIITHIKAQSGAPNYYQFQGSGPLK